MTKPSNIQSVTKGKSKWVNMCLYAIPGAGKTRFIGENPAKTLIIRPAFDHTDSIRSGNADEWVVHDWPEMEEVLQYARHDLADDGYVWCWLDSVSLFQKAGLDDIWEQVLHEKPERGRYGVDKGEHGINMDRILRWIRHMVGVEAFNFGVTAHPFWAENLEGDPLLMPYIQGKQMPEQVCGMMNVVAYLELLERADDADDDDDTPRRRRLRTWATDQFYAKDQFDALPKGKLTDPTIEEFAKRIEAARKGGGSRKRATRSKTAGAATKRRRTNTKTRRG